MKKIFQMFFLLLIVLSQLSFAQVDVESSLIIDDGAGGTKTIYFGLDSLATDGIDVQLGESDLPPFPPPGAFEARFFLPDNNFTGTLGSYNDYRLALLPYTGQKEFRLAYQPGTGTVINISWDLHPQITGQLLDIITGTLINIPMTGIGSYQVTNPAAFNRLKMLVNYTAIIPVELTSFSASLSGTNVVLNWNTATETNNQGFEVYRSFNNSVWENIGFVNGNGTTTNPQEYNFIDNKLSSVDKYYYKLKQIDFDGSYAWSKIVELDFITPTKFNLNQNYPNPFNPSTTISFSIPNKSNVVVKIFDVIGNEISTLVNGDLEAGYYNYNFDASKLTSGVYLYSIKTDNFYQTKKMTLVK